MTGREEANGRLAERLSCFPLLPSSPPPSLLPSGLAAFSLLSLSFLSLPPSHTATSPPCACCLSLLSPFRCMAFSPSLPLPLPPPLSPLPVCGPLSFRLCLFFLGSGETFFSLSPLFPPPPPFLLILHPCLSRCWCLSLLRPPLPCLSIGNPSSVRCVLPPFCFRFSGSLFPGRRVVSLPPLLLSRREGGEWGRVEGIHNIQ